MLPILASIVQWFSALAVVCAPFFEMGLLWLGWQVGIGWLAWSTARFYSSNCAPAGISGFCSSLFTMGSPVCIGAWFSHATFVVAYITAFVVAVLLVTLCLWNRVTKDSNVKKLQKEIEQLQGRLQGRKIVPKDEEATPRQPEMEAGSGEVKNGEVEI